MRGLSGSFILTWCTPVQAAASTVATAARPRSLRLRSRAHLSDFLRVGRVELGESRVVLTDVLVGGVQRDRLLVFLERRREVAVGLEGDGEVVVGARVVRLGRDGELEPEPRFLPIAEARHPGPVLELLLRTRLLRAPRRAAAEEQSAGQPQPGRKPRSAGHSPSSNRAVFYPSPAAGRDSF